MGKATVGAPRQAPPFQLGLAVFVLSDVVGAVVSGRCGLYTAHPRCPPWAGAAVHRLLAARGWGSGAGSTAPGGALLTCLPASQLFRGSLRRLRLPPAGRAEERQVLGFPGLPCSEPGLAVGGERRTRHVPSGRV